MDITKKIALMTSIAIMSILLTTCFIAWYFFEALGEDSSNQLLDLSQKTLQISVDKEITDYKAMAEMFTTNAQLTQAIAENNANALQKMARSLVQANASIDYLTIANTQGTILARGHSEKNADTVSEAFQSLLIPLAEKKIAGGMEIGQEIPLRLGVGIPIYNKGIFVGAIAYGRDMSKHTFVKNMKNILGMEVTIFTDDVRTTTTIVNDGKPAVGTKLNNPFIYDSVMKEGKVVLSTNMILGESYSTAYWPWKNLQGERAGILFAGLPRAEFLASEQRALSIFFASGLAIGLLMLFIGYKVSKAITRPLITTTRYAERVAAGDYSQELTYSGKDEVGSLVCALRHMVDNIRTALETAKESALEAERQTAKVQSSMQEAQEARNRAEEGQKNLTEAAAHVDEVVTHLHSLAGELDLQVQSSTARAEEQLGQVHACTEAMEQMNSAVIEIAQNASVVSQGSSDAKNTAERGASIATQSANAIFSVQAQTQEMQNAMHELGAEAEGISAVITVINDIADQTNLLALNAAIEAARAGEAGRGFAVVADEVRKLAEKTTQATQEVSAVIKSIQQKTRKSSDLVINTTQTLNNTAELMKESGGALEQIVEEASRTASQVVEIATAAEEQSATSESITLSLDSIHSGASETTSSMQNAAHAVNEMSKRIDELRKMMRRLQP